MMYYRQKQKSLLYNQDFKCASCNKPFEEGEKIDLAHKIKASKFNYKEYGREIIDHILNLAATHTGKCNDAQNMSRAAHPVEAMQLIEEIKQDLGE